MPELELLTPTGTQGVITERLPCKRPLEIRWMVRIRVRRSIVYQKTNIRQARNHGSITVADPEGVIMRLHERVESGSATLPCLMVLKIDIAIENRLAFASQCQPLKYREMIG